MKSQKFFPGLFGLTGAARGNIIKELIVIAFLVVIVAAVVLVTRAQRRIPGAIRQESRGP